MLANDVMPLAVMPPARRLATRGACLVILALLLPGLLALGAAPAAAQFGPPSGPRDVGVMTLERAAVPYSVTLPGRAVARDETEIRPRVGGAVKEVVYTPGSRVSAGDVLFRLDSDTYEVALDAAEANRDSAEAALSVAQSTVDRYSQLTGVGFTRADLDQAQATLASARATLASSQASLKSAQLDLERTEIRSPIDGIADIAEVSVGTLVTASQTTPLTTVTRIDPIYVDVQESSVRMLRTRQRIKEGSLQPAETIGIALQLENGQEYEGEGRLITPSVQVSTSTGTVDFRIEFDNPDRLILPGQFLRVSIVLGTTQAILVPQRATTRNSDGTLTAFVAEEGAARQVTLTTQGAYRNAWIVTAGLREGEQIIVDGLRDLRAGAEVNAVPVTIDDTGVVQDAPAASE